MNETSTPIQYDNLVEKLKSVQSIIKREEAGERIDGEPNSSDLKPRLDNAFWRQAGEVAESMVSEDLPKELLIADEAKLFLDFAVFPHETLDSRIQTNRDWLSAPNSEPTISFLHEGLIDAYRSTLRVDALAKLEKRLGGIQQELTDWPDFHIERIKFRDKKISETMDGPKASELTRLFSEMDEKLEMYSRMEYRNRNEGWHTPEERKQWITIKQCLGTRQEAIDKQLQPLAMRARGVSDNISSVEGKISDLLARIKGNEKEIQVLNATVKKNSELGERGQRLNTKPKKDITNLTEKNQTLQSQIENFKRDIQKIRDGAKLSLGALDILAAAEAVQESVRHLMDLHVERRTVDNNLREEQSAVHEISASEVRVSLQNEVSNVKGLMRLAARYGKTSECAVPFDETRNWVTPEEARDCLNEIEEFDPELFYNPGVKRYGRPSIFLAPGVGVGVYDADRNRLIVPQRHMGSVLASVANAVVLYRVDVDSAYNERKMFSSYKEDIKENKKTKSNLKLRMRLIKEYLIWVTKEAKGNGILPREIREWFEWNIAPRKADPWIPSDGRGLTIRQMKAKIAEEDNKEVSAEQQYRLAIFYWMMDADNENYVKQKCLPLIKKALELEPEGLKYIYSAAAFHKKVRDFQRAIELFNQFSRDAKQSWWTKKAIELCSQCR